LHPAPVPWRNTAVGDFSIDTAVEGADGRYRARLSREWEIWGPNGGYVAAIALRAAGAATTLRRPATFACHFLNVADFDLVDLEVKTQRASKRAVSLRVSMTQKDRPILQASVWVVADGSEGFERSTLQKPDAPPPSALKSIEELIPPGEIAQRHRFWGNLECRPTKWVPWRVRQAGEARVLDWYRFRPRATFDDPFLDAARALLLIDTMTWPANCRAYREEDVIYSAPSLDVNVHFHAAEPESDFLLVEARAPVASGGLIGGRTDVWSMSGRLLASGTSQLFCRPAPPPAA
jgi:acyl-CoA thioesterase